MSFPRYPRYKDSRVEWLGQIPEHWSVMPLHHLTDPNRPIMYGIVLPGPDVDEGIPLLKGGNVRPSRMNLGSMARTTPEIEAPYARARLATGDLVYSIRGSIGDCEQVPPPLAGANITQDVARVAIKAGLNPAWARWALLAPAVREDLECGSLGAAVRGINIYDLKRARLPVPPRTEQDQIAAFLKGETTRLDALIAEQQRLMELLKEKRQAVISHAVTKGLNPEAPMKPSGIEWLGDIPAHWQFAAVRRFIGHIEQGWSPECLGRPAEETEWGVLKAGCVNHGVYVEDENKALPETLAPIVEYEVRAGDVIMSRASGSPHLVGSTAFVKKTRPNLMLSDKTFRIHVRRDVLPEFFVAAFNSHVMRSQIERAISGAEGLANNLPQAALKAFSLALPPLHEQESIARVASQHSSKLDALTAEAQRAIDLLQERRTALISAAVTGQIDVRQHVGYAPVP